MNASDDASRDDLLRGDFFGYQRLLDDHERGRLLQLRAFLAESVAPIVDDYWMRAEFPHEIIKGFADLDLGGLFQPRARRPVVC